jgi:glyoxylase-like metal-dependent hydrolase (beta-lactamase superfamily II)
MLQTTDNRIIELAENFYLVTAPNQSRFPYCNTFLLTGGQNVLIDAGIDRETLTEIDRQIRIDALVISHSHPDHIFNWHLLKDRHIAFPVETPEAVKDLHLLGQRFMGSPEKAAYWANKVSEWIGLRPLREADHRFSDGEVLEIDDFALEAILTPGHLNDHYVFFERKRSILLSSDIDFSTFGPFYGQPECDIERFKQSIHKVMALPYHLVCSSHKSPISGDATPDFRKFLDGFELHQAKIADICDSPLTLDQITAKSPLYQDRMPDKVFQHTFEKGMIAKSLPYLLRAGRLRVIGDRYVRVSPCGID